MPIANDFFNTFRQLAISENPWVLIGNIINYISDRDKKTSLDFLKFSEDIEKLHSEIQEKLYNILNEKDVSNSIEYKAYRELIFMFVSTINEIQNGDISNSHINLAKQLTKNDSIITFNWDTLMDRALKSETDWNVENGYFIKPNSIFRNEWIPIKVNENKDHLKLLKLHGSSNWITSHLQPTNGKLELSQETRNEDFYVFEYATKPYSTFKGRYMDGYNEFSYGYYPPNLPLNGKAIPEGKILVRLNIEFPNMPKGVSKDIGLTSMPLIIPPVKSKEYNLFGTLFTSLWNEAEKQLQSADEIYVIGYSFPISDIRTDLLFKKAFVKRTTIPKIVILNPNPESIYDRFIFDYGIQPKNITVRKKYFDDTFQL